MTIRHYHLPWGGYKMKLKLIGANEISIPDLNLVLNRNDVFECKEDIGKSLLIQGIFEEIKDKKGE